MEGGVPVEEEVLLYVNGSELLSLRCTPLQLEELAVGFLYNEGLITGMEDVADVRLCGSGRCVDVWLYKDISLPALRTITSGCSGGTTFVESLPEPTLPDLKVTPAQVLALMRGLHDAGVLYREGRGVHTSALAEGTSLVLAAEDLGRHNTLDKLAGAALLQDIPMAGRILLTSGRVSSEMLVKAARMGTPVVVSRTSPTSLSLDLARTWGITLIGYVRGQVFQVYAGEHRISGLEPSAAAERL